MNRDLTLLLLRLAFSVVCGTVCLLLIVLWIRSYSYVVNIQTLPMLDRAFQCSLLPGRIVFAVYRPDAEWISTFSQIHKSEARFVRWDNANTRTFALNINDYGSGYVAIRFSYWFAASISTALATIPWLSWSRRFSLRTLLIATTLAALVLGAIVFAVR
jgi:hypothetical protein